MNNQAIYHDGTTIDVFISGIGRLATVQSVDWGTTVEETLVRGSGQKVIGRTPGIINVENPSLTLLRSEHFSILSRLGNNYQSLLNKVFDVTVTYSIPGQPVNSVTLRDCRIVSVSHSDSLGDASALETTWELSSLGIDNGSANAFVSVDISFNW